MWFVTEGFAVAFIPKAGTNTFRQWLGQYEVYENDDPRLMEYDKRIAFIRHPVERLTSAYSYFGEKTDRGVPHSVKAPVKLWEEFVDHMLKPENVDVHWAPQSLLIGGKQNIVHRFEDLKDIAPTYVAKPIPWHNKSKHRVVSNYRLPDIYKYYARDLALWSQAHSL